MIDVRSTLLKAFTKHSLQEVESGSAILIESFGQEVFEAVTSLAGYNIEYKRVAAVKERVERLEESFHDCVGDQALQCLNWLESLREDSYEKNAEYAIAYYLIMNTLYLKWPESDQIMFNARIDVIENWTDFFISYTRRNAFEINNIHEDLITQHFAISRERDQQLLQDVNYVAKVIVKYLEEENVKIFVDYNRLELGDSIPDSLSRACRGTIAFVQLVESASLKEPKSPNLNWCLEEYTTFAAAKLPLAEPKIRGNRLFFILAGDDVLPTPAYMGPSYKSWHARMANDLHVVITKHKRPFRTLKLELAKLANQIVATRAEIKERILQSWP